jgi:basic membrane protein A and related proteins
MKKNQSLYFVLIVALFLSGCAPASPSATPVPTEPIIAVEPTTESTGLVCEGYTFGLITSIGGIGDNSIGTAVYNAFTEGETELGYTWDYSEPMSATDIESMIIDYAKTGNYDLILLAGNEGLDPVNAVGPEYPDQKFVVYDVQAEGNSQYISEYYAKNQIGFVAGVLAALYDQIGEVTIAGTTTQFTPSGKIGLVMGEEYTSTLPALTGAAAGFKYINPDNEYLYGIVGNWDDQAKDKELALSMYDQGAHFIFHNAGGGAIGIVQAAKESGQFFIGYDTDQVNWDPSLVIGSSRKQNTAVITRVLREYCEKRGALAWGTSELNDATNGGIGFNYNPDLTVPAYVSETIDQVILDLKEGRIIAPNTWDEVEAFTSVLNN